MLSHEIFFVYISTLIILKCSITAVNVIFEIIETCFISQQEYLQKDNHNKDLLSYAQLRAKDGKALPMNYILTSTYLKYNKLQCKNNTSNIRLKIII
jgi:hypothetical protein